MKQDKWGFLCQLNDFLEKYIFFICYQAKNIINGLEKLLLYAFEYITIYYNNDDIIVIVFNVSCQIQFCLGHIKVNLLFCPFCICFIISKEEEKY